MERLFLALLVPLMAFTWLAGPVGGIWLALRGEWWPIGFALFLLIASHFALAIALLPAIVLATPAALAGDRRPILALVLGFPSLVYTAGLMTVWCVGVLLFFLDRPSTGSWVPLGLLAFSVATAPWMYMAQKEAQADPGSGSDGSSLATMFMCLAFVVTLLLLAFDPSRPPRDLWIAFGVVMGAYVAFATWLASQYAAQRIWAHAPRADIDPGL